MNFIEHNKKMLTTYTRDNRSKQLRIAQLDTSGKVLRVFKNRYQAAKFILENELTNYHHPKGKGYTRACIAGSLTAGISRNPKAYGYAWKILSPYDTNTKITELYQNEKSGSSVQTNHHRWIAFNAYGRAKKYFNLDEIVKEYGFSEYKLKKIIDNGKKINGLSIITCTTIPREKIFSSISEACRILRSDMGTIKKAMAESLLIHNYKIVIPDDVMQANLEKTKNLKKKVSS